MATITLTIPDGVIDRVRDAIAARNGYNPAIHGTKGQFAKTWIIQKVKEEVKSHEGSAAGAAAQQTACDAVDAQITIT